MSARKTVDDDDLIRAAKSGDADAWRALYDGYGGRLIGWLRSQAMQDAALDAEDIASEAWMTAARRIADFSGTDDDFAGWLFVIARNLCANANRRSQRRATTPTDVDPRHLVRHRAEDDADAVAAADWIQRTLAHLSPRERDVVAAIDIAGLDIDTTSRLLSISRAAVRAAHHRAMRRLAEVVDVQATAQPPTIALRTRGARDVSRAALTD